MDENRWKELLKLSYNLKIDRNKNVSLPPMAFSIGTVVQDGKTYDIPFGTYGNFSALIGGSKAGKSYFKSLLIGGYIGGNTPELIHDLRTHRDKDYEILDFDTEQGEWHVANGAKRVDRIVGSSYENYFTYRLRELDFDERLEFIEYCITKKHKRTKLVVIDGIADLISDVNSLAEANTIVQKLMEWTSKYNIHLIAVLHTNWGSDKATGHLGSAVMKKAETVCDLKRNDKVTDVTFPYCRGFKLEDFIFQINEKGLPYVTEKLPY